MAFLYKGEECEENYFNRQNSSNKRDKIPTYKTMSLNSNLVWLSGFNKKFRIIKTRQGQSRPNSCCVPTKTEYVQTQ